MATNLQGVGITSPTILDTRALYQFGPSGGMNVELAYLQNPNTLMSSVVSAAAISANNIPATQTVGQWRASVSNSLGSNLANQVVLAPNS
jgi:hypothetical protein